MKLAEAPMGQDLRGFHIESIFRRDGLDAAGVSLYPPDTAWPAPANATDPQDRKGPFLQAENANACRLADIYGKGNAGPFLESPFVLCDP
ncbi:MAG: hypothetical protein MUC88_14825 [Planctomycetes bacterium]|nr:hypothetical protein [Planctomycetota bacterium]